MKSFVVIPFSLAAGGSWAEFWGHVLTRPWVTALLVCAALTFVLSRSARLFGLCERVGADERERKDPGEAARTPVIGGIALAITLVSVWPGETPSVAAMSALALAWGLGVIDDRRRGGFSAGIKFGLQSAVALLLATALVRGEGFGAPLIATGPLASGPWAFFGLTFFAVAALNLWNTWDHADGNAAGSGLLAFLAPVPAVAGACLGFLFFNLGPAKRRPILGDSGSHLLAACCVLTPAAWPLLVLPALDLARVCLLRLRAKRPLWRGDRRHLAHRLQRRGMPRHAIFFVLLVASAPSLAGPLGMGVTAGAFLLLVALGEGRSVAPAGPAGGSSGASSGGSSGGASGGPKGARAVTPRGGVERALRVPPPEPGRSGVPSAAPPVPLRTP